MPDDALKSERCWLKSITAPAPDIEREGVIAMSMSIWHTIGRQLKNPSGLTGRVIGRAMSIANARPNQLAVNALRIDPCDTVLELGFGPGHAIHAMATQAFAGMVYGIDQSPVMLAQAYRRNRQAIREGRVVLSQAEFDRLPFPHSSIDKLLAVNVIYFWKDAPSTLSEIRRVLRPGGRVSIYATDATTMRYWKFAGPDTHRLYDAAELSAALQQAGFEKTRILVRTVRVHGRVPGLLATGTRPDEFARA
jgi:ubiquinone/menaquinone biosynthesis C-methylase UbiE